MHFQLAMHRFSIPQRSLVLRLRSVFYLLIHFGRNFSLNLSAQRLFNSLGNLKALVALDATNLYLNSPVGVDEDIHCFLCHVTALALQPLLTAFQLD